MINPSWMPRFGEPIGPWRPCYVWWPTRTVDDELLWLRHAERRRIEKHDYLSGGGSDRWWQYRRAA